MYFEYLEKQRLIFTNKTLPLVIQSFTIYKGFLDTRNNSAN